MKRGRRLRWAGEVLAFATVWALVWLFFSPGWRKRAIVRFGVPLEVSVARVLPPVSRDLGFGANWGSAVVATLHPVEVTGPAPGSDETLHVSRDLHGRLNPGDAPPAHRLAGPWGGIALDEDGPPPAREAVVLGLGICLLFSWAWLRRP